MENPVRRCGVKSFFRILSPLSCLLALALLLPAPIFAESVSPNTSSLQVEFQTSQGNFLVELYPDKAPKTVANFMRYVNDHFYKNTIFHRTIQGFMIQGGGFTADMVQKSTQSPIPNEAGNGLYNQTGTIAMARTSDPDSATSQFFINVADNAMLDYRGDDADSIGYCVFGKVIRGMEVVYRISKLPTRNVGIFQNVPVHPIIIQNVRPVLLEKPAK